MRAEEISSLNDIERRIKELSDYQSLGQRPAIKDFTGWAARDIASTNERLSTDRSLMADGKSGERYAMLERKEILLYLINLFDPSAELEGLEKDLVERAESFEEYQSERP